MESKKSNPEGKLIGRWKLENTNPKISSFIYDNLPEILKTITAPFEEREKDVVLLSSLGVLSACIPKIHGKYDGDTIYPNKYILIIAPPASGKGVMNKAKKFIEGIHELILNTSRAEYEVCKKEKIKNYSDCPPVEIKIMPANISIAEMYSYLASSKYGMLIIESEADTMSSMMNNGWSNYSDDLRKIFHHETISLGRKENRQYIEVKEPRLSIVMSGTPGQVQPLLQSKENGLFSRFIFYTYDNYIGFKDVFSKDAQQYNTVFQEPSERITQLYQKLSEDIQPEIDFFLTKGRQKKLVKEFRKIEKDISESDLRSFIPVVRRHALLFFRLCMVLTVLRNIDTISEKTKKLSCNGWDFGISFQIIRVLLNHALSVFETMGKENGLYGVDKELFNNLPDQFKSSEFVDLGIKTGYSDKTVRNRLNEWLEKGIIGKVKQGHYKKIQK